MIKLLHALAYCAAAVSLFACGSNQTFEKSVGSGNPTATPTPTSTTPLGAPTPYAEVNLNWDAPQPSPSPSPSYSWDPPAGYDVFRGTVSGGPYTQIGAVNVPSVTYQDKNVGFSSTYFYVVTTFDAEGNQSPYSNEAAVTIPASLPAGTSRFVVQIKAN